MRHPGLCHGVGCHLCDRATHPAYAERWKNLPEAPLVARGEKQPSPRPTLPPRDVCTRRGLSLGIVECDGCGGGWKGKAFACTLHGKCTDFTKPLPGVNACAGCPDYLPPRDPKAPLRIVHVGTSMARAGAEIQLQSLVKYLDPARMRITECVVTLPQAFDEEMARSLGVPVTQGGRDVVRRAVSGADVLICWGGSLDGWVSDILPPVSIFVAHGEGVWTRRALDGCKTVARHVVAVSEAVKVKACYGYPTTVIPNGIDRSLIAPTRSRGETRRSLGFDDEDFVLAYVGRFSNEKRPHTIIEAVASLPPRYKALLVGWGASEDALRKLAGERIPGRFAFAHAKGDVGDYYAAADAMVSCSAEEGFSLVLLEAMFSGLPVIATPVGSIPEMMTVTPVACVVDGSPSSVADASRRIAGESQYRSSLVAGARDYAESHGYARQMAGKYMDLIEKLWREK